ncbi:hypothetical protein MLD38_031705 [Melastoma candidum]|uniref:Uncharacterized protein n=1 Tax=Melastoma candidum TaxID=119954 RepID=A0ACB9MPY5_9MYRT|nr:hypothetical protein MLD38_031705 [Melastoma candidum]
MGQTPQERRRDPGGEVPVQQGKPEVALPWSTMPFYYMPQGSNPRDAAGVAVGERGANQGSSVSLDRDDDAFLYKPSSKHKSIGLPIFKRAKLAGKVKLLCREIAGHVEYFRGREFVPVSLFRVIAAAVLVVFTFFFHRSIGILPLSLSLPPLSLSVGGQDQMVRNSGRFPLFPCLYMAAISAAMMMGEWRVEAVVTPSTNCYVIDNSSHLVDFSSWVGHTIEFQGKEADLVVRFCKDVETRSQGGYVDFGWFDKLNYFVPSPGRVDYIQKFYNGDLVNCETTYDKLGRTAQVNILCGSCLHGRCKGKLGCICNVTYESTCRVLVELAIPCERQGPRVFQGFTVGFHPRSWEIVYNGMTQPGFEKSNHDFSFTTEQTHITLYMTAAAHLSSFVKKPAVKVSPDEGLDIKLSGTGMTGKIPTTLSPTTLILDWRCNVPRKTPYEVEITIPVDGYEPIQFTLSKMCEHGQGADGDTIRGWAVFGILSCLCLVSSFLLCIGGFIYKTRVERQRGLDALPGITVLTACLEKVSGGSAGYTRPEDFNSAFASQVSWEQQSQPQPQPQPQPQGYNQRSWTPNEPRTYGSM